MAVPFTFGNFVKYWLLLALIVLAVSAILQAAIKRMGADTNN